MKAGLGDSRALRRSGEGAADPTSRPALPGFPPEICPPRSLLTLTALALLFILGLVLIAGFNFSDGMIPPFWVALDYRALEPQWQYLSGNALYNLLGHVVTLANGGQLTAEEFHAAGIAAVAICYVVLFSSSIVRFGVERAAIFLGCVALTSLDSTLLHWIGKPDPLFVCAYLIVFFGRTNVWLTALGTALLIGVHREIGSVVCVVHVLVLILERRLTLRILLALSGGFLVGGAGVLLYAQMQGLDQARDRLEYALREEASVITYSLKYVMKWIGLALPSVLLGGWWLALNAIQDRRSFLLMFLAIGLATGVAATTHDFTRDASLIVVPVTFYLAEYYARRWRTGQNLPLKWAALLAFVAFIGYEVQDNRILAFSRPFVSVEEGSS
jgi:hypothetical protein